MVDLSIAMLGHNQMVNFTNQLKWEIWYGGVAVVAFSFQSLSNRIQKFL